MKNKRKIRIIAQRRSGHHAILFWLISLIKGPVCYINNFTKVKVKPDKLTEFKNGFKRNHYWHFFNMEKQDVMKEDLFFITNKEVLIFNVEEEDDLKGLNKKIENSRFYPKNNSDEIINILVIRDPYNMFASRLRMEETNSQFPKGHFNNRARKRWICYAKEFLSLTSFLTNKIVINYNKWFSEIEYRKKLSSLLNLEFHNNYKGVPKMGDGSSFDQDRYNGKSHEMKVLERWEFYKEDKRYLSLMKNEKMKELSDKIFGKIVEFN